MSRKIITFAGPGGAGKTPIAVYLSWNLGWGIFSNDAIRSELTNDLGRQILSDPEYIKLRDERYGAMLKLKNDLILDVSVDRQWTRRRSEFADQGIKTFIVSLDLSKDFLLKLYRATGYDEQFAEGWLNDHQKFLDQFLGDVNFSITDQNFSNRMKLTLSSVQDWLKSND